MRRLLPVLLAVLGTAAVAATARADAPPPFVFPVLGPTSYSDDFGDPRADGPAHPGNDLLAPRRAIAVAAEAGTVEFWTTSKTAGCMLYLHGDSGTTYLYIHLNNDLGRGNDNRGSCVPGTAYAPGLADGARVEAGQPVGFVGDSGDANGLHPHLHFEVHPGGGAAVDPYPLLATARHLLFWEPDGMRFSLVLDGKVTAAGPGTLTVAVSRLREWPSHEHQTRLGRTLTLAVPPAGAQTASASAARTAAAGDRVRLWTGALVTTPEARAGDPGAISVAKLLVR